MVALIFALILATTIANPIKSTQWLCSKRYFCVIDSGTSISHAKRYESQNDCRLSCGKYGAIWPMPSLECILGQERIHFDPSNVNLNVTAPSPETTEYIVKTNRIFLNNIRKECLTNCSLAKSQKVVIIVSANSSDLTLNWKTDESYQLYIWTTVTATIVDIKAPTVYGARHAFETLSNLITGSREEGLLMVKVARINDRPCFPHRGLLLDTSRNFIPIQQIRNTIDAMAASKLNVFHWHVVDSHSFPLEIKRVPEMQRYGAYSKTETYSRKETVELIKYARERGVRVIIEIDGPAHAGNGWQWGPMAGLGHIAVCINEKPFQKYCLQPPCGQLNPMNSNMYSVMKDIYKDIAEVGAPEETIHMGGEETFIPCWNNTPEIKNEMIENGYDLSLNGYLRLWSEFHKTNLESWDEVNRLQHPQLNELKPVIVWSSSLTATNSIKSYLPNERFIIQTGVNSKAYLNDFLLKRGYSLIISTQNAWHLDHGYDGNNIYRNWSVVYDNEIISSNSMVLGGEVCMWSEFIDHFTVESRIWPRAGAAAERLWSNPQTNYLPATYRFYRYRNRLLSRGIQAEALASLWCVINEGQCL